MCAIVERLPPLNVPPAFRPPFFVKAHPKPIPAGTEFLKERNVSYQFRGCEFEKMEASCVCQSGKRTENTWINRSFDSTELAGRLAGVGYSFAGIGVTIRVIKGRPFVAAANHGVLASIFRACSKMACVKPNQVVCPPAVI